MQDWTHCTCQILVYFISIFFTFFIILLFEAMLKCDTCWGKSPSSIWELIINLAARSRGVRSLSAYYNVNFIMRIMLENHMVTYIICNAKFLNHKNNLSSKNKTHHCPCSLYQSWSVSFKRYVFLYNQA